MDFVDPITGVHTQTIESYWSAKKAPFKTMRGYSNLKLLKSYLAELMWRDRYGDDAFNNLCHHMSMQYPM